MSTHVTKSHVLALATAVALIAALALAPTPAPAGGSGAKIRLGDNFFKPKKKTVSRGTTVKFKWKGDNLHNVTKKKGPGGKFTSTTTSADGVNFKKAFKKRGTYKLLCQIHPPNMKMTLRVR